VDFEFRVGYLEYLPLVKSFGVRLRSESGLDLIFATEMNWDLVSVSSFLGTCDAEPKKKSSLSYFHYRCKHTNAISKDHVQQRPQESLKEHV
jgi:hypothetical protein